MPSIYKYCWSQCQAFTNNVLSVLWDFRGLQSSKSKIDLVQIFGRPTGSNSLPRPPTRLGKKRNDLDDGIPQSLFSERKIDIASRGRPRIRRGPRSNGNPANQRPLANCQNPALPCTASSRASRRRRSSPGRWLWMHGSTRYMTVQPLLRMPDRTSSRRLRLRNGMTFKYCYNKRVKPYC
jgi:hypothetical protein